MRKYRDIKLVTTETRRNYFVSEPNYHTKKLFPEYVLAIKIYIYKKTHKYSQTVYLILSVLEISKMITHEF